MKPSAHPEDAAGTQFNSNFVSFLFKNRELRLWCNDEKCILQNITKYCTSIWNEVYGRLKLKV